MKKVTVGYKVTYKGTEYEVISANTKVVVLIKTAEADMEEPKQYRVKVDSDRYNEIFATPSLFDEQNDDVQEDDEELAVKKETAKKKVKQPAPVEDDEEVEETPAPKVKKVKQPAPVEDDEAPKSKKKTKKEVEPEPEEEPLADFKWEDFTEMDNRIARIASGETPTDRLLNAAMYSVSDLFTSFLVWTFINTDKLNIDYDLICELMLDGEKPVVADKDRPKAWNDEVISGMWNWLDTFALGSKVPTEQAHIEFIKIVPVEHQEYFFYLATNLGWNSFQSLKINKANAQNIHHIANKIRLDGGM